mgnify:CR=1 FL=1|jgi:hypothetical protein
MVMGHVDVDPALRGAGSEVKVATEIFEHLINADHEIRLTCPFLPRVGVTRTEWRTKNSN